MNDRQENIISRNFTVKTLKPMLELSPTSFKKVLAVLFFNPKLINRRFEKLNYLI